MRSPIQLLLSLLLGLAACDGRSGGGAGGSGGAGGAAGASTGGSGGAPGPVDLSDPAMMMINAQIEAANVDRTRAGWRTALPRPAVVTFTAGKSYVWVISTSKGELRIRLRPEVAPMHVTSTIYLTLLGFYDTLTFHRILKGFMAQGGDPLGNGTGSPGYSYAVEASDAAKHDARGVLSMANAGANTEGSQFFITFAAQRSLDGKYSVFGNLVSGNEALTAIEAVGTVAEGRPGLVTIDRATISVE